VPHTLRAGLKHRHLALSLLACVAVSIVLGHLGGPAAAAPAVAPSQTSTATPTPAPSVTDDLPGRSAPKLDQAVEVRRGSQTIWAQPLRTVRVADGREVLADRLVVGFQEGLPTSQFDDVHRAVHTQVGGGAPIAPIGRHAQLVDVGRSGSLDRALQAYRADPRVRYAEPDFVAHTSEVPNDPRFGEQWGLARIQAPAAWNITHGSATRVVAVLDCGIYDEASSVLAPDGATGHPDLRGKVTQRRDFSGSATATDDYCNHGTHVAGIAAAGTNNGVGIAGVGFDTRLLNAKVLNDTGAGTVTWIANGIQWATDSGANVINMSLGAPGVCPSAMQDAINYAWAHNVVVVAAARQLWDLGPGVAS
jgi:thermitase